MYDGCLQGSRWTLQSTQLDLRLVCFAQLFVTLVEFW